MSDPANASTISRPRRRPNGMTHAEIVAYEIGLATRDGECLLTTAHIDRYGYGRITADSRHRRIHRLVIERKIGRDLRTGEQALHTCHRRACINPDHLYAGSPLDNVRDMDNADRGGRSFSRKLAVDQVLEIRRRCSAGESQVNMAREFGVAEMTVSNIVRRKIWKRLSDE